jgi:hypothetical protein
VEEEEDWCEIWSHTLKNTQCTSVEGAENKVGNIKIQEEKNGDNYIMRSFTDILFNSN